MNNGIEGMKPIFSKPEDEIAKKVGESLTGVVKDAVEQGIDPIRRKVEDLDKKVSDNTAKSSLSSINSSKVSDIIDRAKEKRRLSDIAINSSDIIEKDEHGHLHHKEIDGTIPCPTCHKHKMKMNPNGISAKCTGEGCNSEVAIAPKDSDFKCMTCGFPIKKPELNSKVVVDGCPFCGNSKATEFNWNNLKGRK